jgi:hypothetical protein
LKTSRKPANYKKSIIFFGGAGALACYDYFLLDGEFLGAGLRFLRSLKIALQISMDYRLGLRGLEEDSEEYNLVKIASCGPQTSSHDDHCLHRKSKKSIKYQPIGFSKDV